MLIPSPVPWLGGTEFAVANAPPGYETLHYGPHFGLELDNVPDGQYLVTMSFLEPSIQAMTGRVFHVLINDQPVIFSFDVYARAGFMVPCFRSVVVSITGGRMIFDFVAEVRSAIVSGIVIEPLTNLLLTS